METLAEQFRKVQTNIGLGDKRQRAIDAHTQIREALEKSEALKKLGVETVLIGSYGRETAIYPGKDVDVFTKLTKGSTSDEPGGIFELVRDTLVEHYDKRAEPQDRSIKIDFPDDFGVDVVPAVPMGKRWGIPNRDPAAWDNTDERWVETDPERLGKLTIQRNREPKIDGQGAYVPTVKMIRQTRKHHLGDNKPGGLYFELLTYQAFEDGAKGDFFAELLAEVLRRIADQLKSDEELIDPGLERPYAPQPKRGDLNKAASNFGDLAAKAEEALTLEPLPGSEDLAGDPRRERPRQVLPSPSGLRRAREDSPEVLGKRGTRIGTGEWLRVSLRS